MQYTLVIDKTGKYDLIINSGAKGAGGILKIEINGLIVEEKVQLPTTQVSGKWQPITLEGLQLPQGEVIVKFHIVKEGSDLRDFLFVHKG